MSSNGKNCPIKNANCTNRCAWFIENVGCAMVVCAQTMPLNGKALYEIAKAVDKHGKPLSGGEYVLERAATDSELERYVESINPLTIANTKTSDFYEKFKAWCKERSLVPFGQQKVSNKVCEVHPFECKTRPGYFTLISKEAR